MVASFVYGVLASIPATKEVITDLSPYDIQPIHLAFWVIGIAAIYTTIVQGIRIRRLEGAKPKIKVEPKVYNNRAILEVWNNGGEGDFTAKGRVTTGIPEPELYTMYWESVPDIKCHIDGRGGRASILVAERAERTMLRDEKTSIYEGDLTLFKMGTSGEQVFPTRSYVETKQIRNGKEVIRGTIEAKCIIEVTITSSPSLTKPFENKRFLLEFDDRRNLVFTEEVTHEHIA